jgi:hypothetical protein
MSKRKAAEGGGGGRPSLGGENVGAALHQLHVEAEKTTNMFRNLSYADEQGTPGKSVFLYMLSEELRALEGMPVTPFAQGAYAGIASIMRRKRILFLQPGSDGFPRYSKFFSLVISGCAPVAWPTSRRALGHAACVAPLLTSPLPTSVPGLPRRRRSSRTSSACRPSSLS